jgi:16S rRNA (uracil1498-N3)-methyltransferase
VLKVLRARAGDVLEVVDGRGGLFVGRLLDGGELAVVESIEAPEESGEVVLYQAVPKGARMDLVVEKATEVGVTSIVPLLTGRGVVAPRAGKVERWRRVAEAAARQSLRLRVPDVREPLPFEAAVRSAAESGVILHNAEGVARFEDVVGSPVSLFVGPEGGWEEEELLLAEESGLAIAGLGPFRLRSETAGIVAVARARGALEAVSSSIEGSAERE